MQRQYTIATSSYQYNTSTSCNDNNLTLIWVSFLGVRLEDGGR